MSLDFCKFRGTVTILYLLGGLVYGQDRQNVWQWECIPNSQEKREGGNHAVHSTPMGIQI